MVAQAERAWDQLLPEPSSWGFCTFGCDCGRSGHASVVGDQSKRQQSRRHEIGDRIADIRMRIDELQQAQRVNRHPVPFGEQFAEAQHHATASEARAQLAVAASIEAFLRAAEAHERVAIRHEASAAAGSGDEEQHHQRAAFHRAAAAADRQRAETAQSLLAPALGTAGKTASGSRAVP